MHDYLTPREMQLYIYAARASFSILTNRCRQLGRGWAHYVAGRTWVAVEIVLP